MPASLDATGLTIPDLTETQAEIAQALLDGIGDTLDVSEGSYLGQVVGAFARQVRTAYELVQAAYTARDPDSAEGFALAGLCAILGVDRRPASASYVLCDCALAVGSYSAGQLVAHVAGDPTKRFSNRDPITSPGGINYDLIFVAEETGPISVNTATLTVMAEAVTGWTAITNTEGTGGASSYLGTNTETDAELRLRRIQNLAKPGTGSVDAIRADLLAVDGVSAVSVIDNVTDTVDANGLPAHSVAAVVRGGVAADIAAALLAAAPAGVATHGTTTTVVTDAQGVDHSVKHTVAVEVPLYCEITFYAIAGEYAGDDAVKAAILAEFGNMPSGKDVKAQRLFRILSVPGVTEIDSILLDDVDPPVSAADIVIPYTSYGNLEADDITITVNLISGYP